MSPTAHNRILGLLHLLYGVFCLILMIVITVFISGLIDVMASNRGPGETVPVATLALIIVGVVFLNILLITPSFIAGYALAKRKPWARKIGIVAGILAALTFPFGTALCVYTLWFLFGEKGRFLYHSAAYALPPPPASRKRLRRPVQPEYVPPSSPPDWR